MNGFAARLFAGVQPLSWTSLERARLETSAFLASRILAPRKTTSRGSCAEHQAMIHHTTSIIHILNHLQDYLTLNTDLNLHLLNHLDDLHTLTYNLCVHLEIPSVDLQLRIFLW